MPKSESSTKFIERNRAPRVHIQYDVDINGAEKKIELPFVMGVMADLSGKSLTELPPVDERKFLEFDMDNFDARMRAIKPRVAFSVPNVMTDEGGNIAVDVTFESMDDFTPEAIAKKVEPVRKLLDARTKLTNLLTFMDGRTKAEDLMDKLVNDPALMKSVMESSNTNPSES